MGSVHRCLLAKACLDTQIDRCDMLCMHCMLCDMLPASTPQMTAYWQNLFAEMQLQAVYSAVACFMLASLIAAMADCPKVVPLMGQQTSR